MMTTTEAAAIMAETDYGTEAEADYDGSTCQVCGGPAWFWRGSEHGYTCGKCIDAYLDEGAARWAAKPAKTREKITRNLLHGNDNRTPVTADNGRRRDGGDRVMYRPPLPASADSDTDSNHQHRGRPRP